MVNFGVRDHEAPVIGSAISVNLGIKGFLILSLVDPNQRVAIEPAGEVNDFIGGFPGVSRL